MKSLQAKLSDTAIVLFTGIAGGYIIADFHPDSLEWMNTHIGRFIVVFFIIWASFEFTLEYKELFNIVVVSIGFTVFLFALQRLSHHVYDEDEDGSASTVDL